MNITKREWELAMESESNREMAMRILESPKAAEAAVQRAECRMQNEGAAEATMQNAKPLGSNGEAIEKRLESNGAEYRRPQCGKEAEWKPSEAGNFQASLTSDKNDDTELWEGQEQQSARNAKRPQHDIANDLAIEKPLEPGAVKERRKPDLAFWSETSKPNAECKVLNAELRARKPDYAFWEGRSNQSAESKTESEEATVTDIEGLKVINVPKREEGSAECKVLNAELGTRKPDYAFWEENSENPQLSPSFPGQQADLRSTLHAARSTEPSPQDKTDGPQLSMVAQGADTSALPASLGLRSAFIPPSGQQNSAPWGALPGRELPGEFPLTALPSLALAMVVNVSDSVQVSYGMTACMVLGAVSAAAAGRLSVRVSKDYEEPLQLFIAAGANPSERKSACMGMVFHSLNEYEIEENARRAPAVRHYKESRELLEEGIARAKKSGDRLKMSDLIDELNSMQEVKDYELLLTDATPEALSRAMSRNGGRMALVSSEGAFLNILAGGYSSGGAANVDVVLKGYSGEPVRVERIGRGSEKITKASLSLCLAVQPDLLETFLSDPTLAGRGMASRFLCCLPQSRVGARTLAGIPAKQEVLDAFGHRLREILSKPEGTELTLSP